MDFIRIEYQPSLGFEAFHQVDMDCFPDEPLDLDGFQFRLSQDFWAAMDGENLAGYCCVFRKGSLAWLGRLGVNPSYRRHGIGTELLKTAIQFSREMGMQEMMLYVLEDNFAALHIYEQFGFVRDEITYQYIWDTSHPDSLVVPDNVPRIRLLPVDEAQVTPFQICQINGWTCEICIIHLVNTFSFSRMRQTIQSDIVDSLRDSQDVFHFRSTILKPICKQY